MFGLSGCGLARPIGAGVTGTGSQATGIIKGSAFGGQSPVVGAHIYLYATSSTYGGASTSLLSVTTDSVTEPYTVTDSAGAFNITGDYNCPSGASLVYLLGVGGDAGDGANSKLTEMAALGPCTTLKTNAATTFINMNEVTTVAAVYALAPFMESATAVGAPGSNLGGIANAFSMVNNLVNPSTGVALTTTLAGNGAVPNRLINTLADFISICVNSDGTTTGSTSNPTPCDQVFEATTVNGAVPSDTVGALLAIAKNPGNNPGAVYNAQPAQPPFLPTLTASPNDLTMAIVYTGGGLAGPTGIAIDKNGNAWVSDFYNSTLFGFQAGTGATLTPPGGNADSLYFPIAAAFGADGNLWVTNCGGQCNQQVVDSTVPSVTLISSFSNGTGLASSLVDQSLAQPYAITIDSTDRAWIANASGNGVTIFDKNGTFISNPGQGYSYSDGVSADNAGNVWASFPHDGLGAAVEWNSNITQIADDGGTGATPDATAIAVSPVTELPWVSNSTNGIVVLSNNQAIDGSPYTGGGINHPGFINFDGSGAAFIMNETSPNTVSMLSASGTPLSPSTGFTFGQTNPNSEFALMALDSSGNLWITAPDADANDDAGILQVIGIATPVTTPIVSSLGHPMP